MAFVQWEEGGKDIEMKVLSGLYRGQYIIHGKRRGQLFFCLGLYHFLTRVFFARSSYTSVVRMRVEGVVIGSVNLQLFSLGYGWTAGWTPGESVPVVE